jgi:hypothetical protein
MDNTILEYLEGYFGNELNESTSDEDIMEAFADLLETADAVEEYLDEAGLLKRVAKKLTGPIRARRKLAQYKKGKEIALRGDPTTSGVGEVSGAMAQVPGHKSYKPDRLELGDKTRKGERTRLRQRASRYNRASNRVRKLLGK